MKQRDDGLGLLGNTRDALFVIDRDQRTIYWNEEAKKLLGYAAADVLGKPSWRVIRGQRGNRPWRQQNCRIHGCVLRDIPPPHQLNWGSLHALGTRGRHCECQKSKYEGNTSRSSPHPCRALASRIFAVAADMSGFSPCYSVALKFQSRRALTTFMILCERFVEQWRIAKGAKNGNDQ
jgi:PAS domain-containing protein